MHLAHVLRVTTHNLNEFLRERPGLERFDMTKDDQHEMDVLVHSLAVALEPYNPENQR